MGWGGGGLETFCVAWKRHFGSKSPRFTEFHPAAGGVAVRLFHVWKSRGGSLWWFQGSTYQGSEDGGFPSWAINTRLVSVLEFSLEEAAHREQKGVSLRQWGHSPKPQMARKGHSRSGLPGEPINHQSPVSIHYVCLEYSFTRRRSQRRRRRKKIRGIVFSTSQETGWKSWWKKHRWTQVLKNQKNMQVKIKENKWRVAVHTTPKYDGRSLGHATPKHATLTWTWKAATQGEAFYELPVST